MQDSGNNIRGLAPDSRRKEQDRGFAPIGIVEYWNIGKMGLSLRLRENTEIMGK